MKTNKLLRADACEALRGKWAEAVLACLVFMVITYACSGLSSVGEILKMPVISIIAAFIILIFIVPLAGGYSISFLRLFRGDNQTVANTFRATGDYFGKLLGGMLLIAAITILLMIPFFIIFLLILYSDAGTMNSFADSVNSDNPFEALRVMAILFPCLLIYMIPVMLVIYRYQLFTYALEDNPEMGVFDAFEESKRLTKGHIWKLFGLDLSFIGWYLLSVLTFGIGVLWVQPYQYTARAAFYHNRLEEDALNDKPITPEELATPTTPAE